MTPEQYLDQLGELMAAGRDRDALAFAKEMKASLDRRLSLEQIDFVGGLLEGAAMAVAMEDAEAPTEESSGAPRTARSA